MLRDNCHPGAHVARSQAGEVFTGDADGAGGEWAEGEQDVHQCRLAPPARQITRQRIKPVLEPRSS
jgi:hypothetical protein